MELAEFFEQTAPRLVRLCFLTTLDREAAADAAQEALGRAWRDWGRVGADASDPAAWTTTVALNLQHLSRTRPRLAAELGEPSLELEVESP
jgi:DNA-directed RNA polymerase specialized sigma24 family protein